MSALLLSTHILPSIVLAEETSETIEQEEETVEEVELEEAAEEVEDSEEDIEVENEREEEVSEENEADETSVLEVTEGILAELEVELSEKQNLIIRHQSIPAHLDVQFSLGQYPTVVEESDFAVTVAAVEKNLSVAIVDSQNTETIEEVTFDVEEKTNELIEQSGEEPIEDTDREGLPDLYNSEEIEEVELDEDARTPEVEEHSSSNSERSVLGAVTTSSSRSHSNGIYTVVQGDTFNSIAEDFNMTPLQLRQWNGHISDVNILRQGERIAVTRQGVESMLSDAERANLISGGDPHYFGSAQNFIHEMAPLAIEIASQEREEPLYPSLMLAQAMHESGVARAQGMSALASPPYYNMFGIKASGNQSYITAWTWESIQGESVDVLANFRTFSSYRGSFEGYANLLRRGRGTGEDFYYRGTWRSNTNNVMEVLDQGGLRGYATDPAYFEAIERYINNYNLEQYDTNVERIYGDTRFETAAQISQEGWNSSNTVVLADGYNYADALTGSPLASALNAPILLTRSNRLESATRDEINRLNASNVVILGGEHAISSDVEDELANMGLEIERIAGETRYETSGLIAEAVIEETGATTGVLAYGFEFADAMSIAPYAAENGMPILLTPTRDLHLEARQLTDQLNDWYIVGGPHVITGAVGQRLQGRVSGDVTRISGDNRYQTNQRVVSHFGNGGDHSYIASGTDFPDALTGSVLAGREGSNILLVNNQDRFINAQISFSRNNGIANFTIIGGEQALPPRVQRSFSSFRVVQ